jgi:hypothetical protein
MGGPAIGQETVWSHPGLGQTPNLSVLLDGGKATLILVGSPFQGGVLALDPRDGSVRWISKLTERISRPGRMLSDAALFSTHTGTLVALETADGDEMWRQPAEKDHDFAAVSPMVIEGSIYTLSEQGQLCRYAVTGQRLVSRTVETAWQGQQAEFVPMWRDATGLTFLDQAGRIRSFDLSTLATLAEKRVTTAVGPGMGQLGSEVQGGVYSAALGWIWTTELSGLLRSTQVESGATRWTARVGSPESFYSRDGRALAVPILSPAPDQKVLVLTRTRASVLSADSGQVLRVHDLPSPAVAPPIFDLDRQTWWVLAEDHLVALRWDGQVRAVKLPLVERPYTAALAGNILVVGTEQGRIYAMPVPEATTPLSDVNTLFSADP